MKIIARFHAQLGGHVYAPGEACEFDGPVTARIAYNFTAEDGSSLAPDVAGMAGAAEGPARDAGTDEKALVERTVAALKRDGICRALDDMNISYSAKSSTAYLARLLLVNRGEIREEA